MEVPRWLEIALVAFSVAMFVGSLVAIPWVIRRLPPDHFVRPPKAHSLTTKILRNAAGAMLITAGLAMLVLPGQGLLSILFGLSIMDLEIKHRVVRSLLRRRHIQHAVQKIRAKSGKPPLVIPDEPVTA